MFRLENEKQHDFLGNKRKNDNDKFKICNIEKNDFLITHSEEIIEQHNQDPNILDLNILYNTVSPPSELNEDFNSNYYFNIKDNPSNGKKIRKSTRIKKEKSSVFHILNCHHCRKSDNSLNMHICTNPSCQEPFCMQCIRKYYVLKNCNF